MTIHLIKHATSLTVPIQREERIANGKKWLHREAIRKVEASWYCLPVDVDVVVRRTWCVNKMHDELRKYKQTPIMCLVVDPLIIDTFEKHLVEEAVRSVESQLMHPVE